MAILCGFPLIYIKTFSCNLFSYYVYLVHKWGIVGLVPLFVGKFPTLFPKCRIEAAYEEVRT